MIYIFVLFLLLFFFINFKTNNVSRNSKSCWYISLIVLILLSGLRYKVGGDTFAYLNNYSEMPDFSEFSNFDFKQARYDFLWYVFCAICKLFSNDYFFMQLIHSILVNVLIFRFIRRYSISVFTSLLLYYVVAYLYFTTEIMRESLAVAIFLLSIDYYLEKKWIKYYIIALIAYFFHSSAIFVFLLPLFCKVKFTNKYLVSIICICVISGLLWRFFVEHIEMLALSYRLQNRSLSYVSEEHVYNLNGMIYSVLFYFLIPFLCLYFSVKNKINNYFAPFIYIYTVLAIFNIYNSVVFQRFQNYLLVIFLVYVSNFLIESYKKNSLLIKMRTKMSFLVIALIFSIYYPYFNKDIDGNARRYMRYFPYNSVLTKDRVSSRDYLNFYGL